MRLARLLDVTTTAQDSKPPCRCGHVTMAHEHYRRGSDCALCECSRYRRIPVGQGPAVPGLRSVRVFRPYATAPGGAHEHPGAA